MEEKEAIKKMNELLEKNHNPLRNQFIDLAKEDIVKILNCDYIAKRFFGKSGSWFSQKLNHNITNGTPCYFTREELLKLSESLTILGIEIQGIADDIADELKK